MTNVLYGLVFLLSEFYEEFCIILGMLAFLAFCVVMLVVLVIVWRPNDAGIYPMKNWKPIYRSLGAPPPVPKYMSHDVGRWPR